MLILLFICALFRHLQGAPLTTPSIPSSDSVDIFIRDNSHTSTASTHFSTRGVSDIVVSCVATIFACTWTAIHPNIPGPCDSGWEIFKRQVTTMVYALLAPEAITAWALRQHLSARRLAKWYNNDIAKVEHAEPSLFKRMRTWFQRKPMPQPSKQGEVVPWTITHGFFVQMGGFLVCDKGKPVQTLQYHSTPKSHRTNMHYLLKRRLLEPPKVTEAEIKDRSKGDILSKTIVVIQTTWFVAQCFVRWFNSLPVTELEVATLGFAMLNALTYFLWWNKPQSVGLPVYLEWKVSTTERAADEDETELDQSTSTLSRSDVAGNEVTLPAKDSHLSKMLEKDWSTGWQRCWKIPYRLVQSSLRPLSTLLRFTRTFVGKGDLRVPMFYSHSANDAVVFFVSSGIACILGLIHLIPTWFIQFPSHTEMVLWRTSAVIITAQPALLGLWTKLRKKNRHGSSSIRYDRSSPLAILSLIGLPLYIIARITLVVLALIALRALPEPAFIDIDWLSFIPHL